MKNTDGGACQTDGSRDRSKNAEAEDLLLGSRTASGLDGVTYDYHLGIFMGKKDANDIQQYAWPPLQELEIPPGLGRATTKTAMKAAKKIASLENMFKMRVRWVCK
jgi:hypothetical protein